MHGFCRGCLIKHEEPSELLQYTERNRRLFVYSTGIQVKRNDTFTFQLCKDCYLNMKGASKFKKLCRASDKRFKNYIALKESGENIDMCTYLKNNDDALTFRFPLMNGNSTPANTGNKDDDNESTCTSIRNFMTDMLQGEEVPDTEARIIREVIQEEADVLDDSLDSHWLQDDISIDTDFRLDFSFSQFSTPRSNDHFGTPKKLDDVKPEDGDHNYFTSNEDRDSKVSKIENIAIPDDKTNITELKYTDSMDYGLNMDYFNINDTMDVKEDLREESVQPINFYVPADSFDEPVQIQLKDDKMMKSNSLVGNFGSKCTIDRNLNEALKNESNKEFCLDDLLVSPQVPGDSASPAPSITSILFGSKLDGATGERINTRNIGQCIEKYEHVKGDFEIDDEFFDRNDEDLQLHDDDTNNELIMKENEFDLDNSLCKICNKTFKNPKALRIHANKTHNVKLDNPNKDAYKTKLKMCDICGKEFSGTLNLNKHKKRHELKEENKIHKCSHCAMVFTMAHKLEMHMVTHNGVRVVKNTGKKYVCNICGAISNHKSNFKMHQLRHTQNYKKHCDECGKGFFRHSDMIVHMRSHTGERPFKCELCTRSFSRRSGLLRHIKLHIGEKRFCCDYCDMKFVTKQHLLNHMLYSKSCIKARGNPDKQGNLETSGQLDIIYTTGSHDTIKKLGLVGINKGTVQ